MQLGAFLQSGVLRLIFTQGIATWTFQSWDNTLAVSYLQQQRLSPLFATSPERAWLHAPQCTLLWVPAQVFSALSVLAVTCGSMWGFRRSTQQQQAAAGGRELLLSQLIEPALTVLWEWDCLTPLTCAVTCWLLHHRLVSLKLGKHMRHSWLAALSSAFPCGVSAPPQSSWQFAPNKFTQYQCN